MYIILHCKVAHKNMNVNHSLCQSINNLLAKPLSLISFTTRHTSAHTDSLPRSQHDSQCRSDSKAEQNPPAIIKQASQARGPLPACQCVDSSPYSESETRWWNPKARHCRLPARAHRHTQEGARRIPLQPIWGPCVQPIDRAPCVSLARWAPDGKLPGPVARWGGYYWNRVLPYRKTPDKRSLILRALRSPCTVRYQITSPLGLSCGAINRTFTHIFTSKRLINHIDK